MPDNLSDSSTTCEICEEGQLSAGQQKKFKLGWIQGVLVPCMLNIWGVMLFLRISWVVGQAGIMISLVIITISATVCVITTLSMSAICTNGLIKGGGVYYLISRSLGPEFGASVGILFAFANAVAASMNTIGFCDSMNDLLRSQGLKIIDSGVNDVRIVGTIALVVMCIICAVGMDWESKAQNFLIVVIVGAMSLFFIGTLMGPSENTEIAQGFVGFNSLTFRQNFHPDYRFSEGKNHDFFSVFAIFFPSVTGIQAGANISGDLRDPATAIPKGTLLSLLISMSSYAMMVIFSGGGALRHASGNVEHLNIVNGKVVDYRNVSNCAFTKDGCLYGLHNSYTVMQLMSAWGPFIYAGCWAATLSTALTNLLSVPRLIQALGIDRIYPGLIFFSKPYGKHGEPYRGYVLVFIVSLIFLLIADLNTIAPLITNFYLASYALINFCTFHAAFIRPLGWRPTFVYYNIWLSLLGFLLCVVIMTLLSWVIMMITVAVFFTLYLVVHYRHLGVNWGSSAQAQIYKSALSNTYSLYLTGEHAKNYCPQLLVLSGRPLLRPALVDLAHLITEDYSLMIIGIISNVKLSYKSKLAKLCSCNEWLKNRRIRAFCTEVNGFNFEQGSRALMQAAGVGRLCPNILLLGYKADWATCSEVDLIAYFNTLNYAFEVQLALAVLRVPGGFDLSSRHAEEASLTGTTMSTASGDSRKRSNHPILQVESDLDIYYAKSEQSMVHNDKKSDAAMEYRNIFKEKLRRSASDILEMRLNEMNIFHKKQQAGTLDVWWLYDDGGLTILLPHIISERSTFSEVKMRIFALSNENKDLKEKTLTNLLTKFRIKYRSLTIIEEREEEPLPETRMFFDRITEKFKSAEVSNECHINKVELETFREKTDRQLRLRQLLLANSKSARLIVMSMPMPRKSSVSAPLYMAWLETLTYDLPPMLLVRGNHTSVLSHYA